MSCTFAIVKFFKSHNHDLEPCIVTKTYIDRSVDFGEGVEASFKPGKTQTAKQSYAAPAVMEYTFVLLSLLENPKVGFRCLYTVRVHCLLENITA